MALSRQVIISDGTTKQYPITFADGYLSRDEVKVYEEFNDGTPNSDIPFVFINDNLIQIDRVPVSGNKIVIERDVEANARKVNFIPQYIKSSDLNTMYKHLLYLIQAVLDGRFEEAIIKDLNMGFNRIYNLGEPEQDNDAVRLIDIKSYTDLAKELEQKNTAHEAAAKQSEVNAKASEVAAAASAKSAADTVNGFDAHAAEKQNDFADNATAKTDEFNANAAKKQAQVDASASAAKQSEDNASDSADLAESWAIGDISSRPEGSAKWWANQASKGQKQADWNQTDNTQIDYIKNKPDLTVYQTKANLSQAIDESTEKYPSNKAVQDAISDKKLLAYENLRIIECSGSVKVTLQNTEEAIGLSVTDAATISFDVSALTFPKNVYTVQIYFGFPNGAKTISLSSTPSIRWLNNTVPDFSSGGPHWLVLRYLINDTFVLMSDAGKVTL